MLKGIAKLLLLLILVLMATGFPIYFDRIDSESFWERASSRIDVEEVPETIGSVNLNYDLEQPSGDTYLLQMRIDNHGEPMIFEEDLVEFTILHQNQPVNVLTLNDFNIDIPFGQNIGTDEAIDFTVELDRKSLGYPYEFFTMELKLRDDVISLEDAESEISLFFEEGFTYLPAMFTAGGQTALTLYFPTSMENYSVPITRIIPYTDMQIRATVDGLFEGPDEALGLTIPEEGIMPPWQNLAFDGGLATINLSDDLEVFDEDPGLGQQAYQAYAYSINATSFTNRVQFTFNHGTREEAFGGISVENPITLPEGPALYFGYETETERLLLVPGYTEEDSAFNESRNYYNEEYELEDPEGFYQLLRFDGNPDFYNAQRLPLISSSVVLNSVVLEDNFIEFTFADNFMEELSLEAQHAMLDGLLLSYTSFSNIDAVVFTITGYDEETLYHYPIGTPVEAPAHINPEVPNSDS